MRRALQQFSVSGVDTTLAFLRFAIGCPDFAAGKVNTELVEQLTRQIAGGAGDKQASNVL